MAKKTSFLEVVESSNEEVTRTTIKRIAPEIVGVSDAVPMPTRFNRRGSKSHYDLSKLEIGQSLAIKNKTAKQIASVLTNANKKFITPKLDENGKIVYKTAKASDGNGGFIEVNTGKPVLVASKHFFAVDCDSATDPEGASVRIFRDV